MISTCIYRKQSFFLLCCILSFIFSTAQTNPIVTENAITTGVAPFSEWGVNFDFKDPRICGFATKMSVNSDETVRFKIDVPSGVFDGESYPGGVTYTIKIYRIGYYDGKGARLIADLNLEQNFGLPFTGTTQPAPISDPVTGLVDCGNWSESVSWHVPANAVSGLYIAKLQRTDFQPIHGTGANHIVFIVRNDGYHSDLHLQFPDATWQAYNGYGGNSLYNGATGFPNGHAVKVSYNRPFFIYTAGFSTANGISDWYMNNEYPMIRWLERNGYNVTYTTGIDVTTSPAELLIHKVFISLGHDEYWSKEQRDNVEAARNAGVHLAFFSGNEIYWKTRWEDNYRTLVCYKEGTLADGSSGAGAESTCGNKCDPSPLWTGLWRMGGNYDAGKHENKLTGQISWSGTDGSITVPSVYKKLRFWRNTSVAGLPAGQSATLAPQTLGYEWDWEQYPDSNPSGRITMSNTSLNSHTHKLSLYRHSSGALVFGAGTVQWSWGLDNNHFENETTEVSQDMQQATVNLFADMGAQPLTLQAGLIPAGLSADFTAPASNTLSLSNTQPLAVGTTVTFAGDASDDNVIDGAVAGVEVSTDGGTTWKVANNSDADITTTWNYPLTVTSTANPIKILSRGFDDSGNMGIPGSETKVAIAVTLQGRTDVLPNSVWSVPLQIDFYMPDNTTLVASYNVTTNNSGTITITDLPAGTYTIAVKNSHTLKRVKQNQTIAAGYNLVIFDPLVEGDVTNNNAINLADLGALLFSYNKLAGDPDYVANADLNGNGVVNLADLGLLLANYNKIGESP